MYSIHSKHLRSGAVLLVLGMLSIGLLASPCFASFESSLVDIKSKLTGVVLPLLSVIGLGFAALSFVTGNPEAKRHVTYALVGAVVGFGAQAIVDFIASTVH
jgi:hypothetical protein